MSNLLPAVLPDTNFLIEYPSVHRESWLLSPIEILISETVISELRGLTNNDDQHTAQKAKEALREIDKFQGAFADLTKSQFNVAVTIVERPDKVASPLDPKNPDHQLIAFARDQLHGPNPRFCAVLSNDRELCDIAEAVSVLAISRHNARRFHEEIERKHEWWNKTRGTEWSLAVQTKKGERPKPQRTPPDAALYLDRTVKQFYRQFQSVGFRGSIYIAPLQARLALVCETLKRMRYPEKRVLIVSVGSEKATNYWAGKIRQLCGLSINEVQIFGQDPADRIDQARIVIYRHDQIARRLPQHLARLTLAEKQVTAIVDGCDMLDPVELALLLYECDQFIGFHHFPVGHRRGRGNRMLDIVLHNRSLANYSFADAERDSWGHPCDLFFHRVAFTEEERDLWTEINADYLTRRELAVKRYPELGETERFWDMLSQLLDNTAAPDVVDIIKKREQLEQMAQIAQNKSGHVMHLIETAPKKPYRRMILDYARLWTPVLMTQFDKVGVGAAELPDDETQRSVWDHFAGNRIDTLILSCTPAERLPKANFHQMIILTPLRPTDQVIDMINWALTHTSTMEALRINLLYVEDTPEEIAMLELAEASFGLRTEN